MTGPVTTEALVEALAYLKPHETNGGTISLKAPKAREAVAVIEAAHQQVTAERDEDRAEHARYRASAEEMWETAKRHGGRMLAEKRRADVAEASLATATSELARFRADVELLSRAIDMAKAEVAFAQQDEADGSSAASRRVRFRGILYALNGVGDSKTRTALARAATAREGA